MLGADSNKKQIISLFIAIAVICFFGTFALGMKSSDSTIRILHTYSDFFGFGIIGIVVFFAGYYLGKRGEKKMANVVNAGNILGEKEGSILYETTLGAEQFNPASETANMSENVTESKKDDLSKGVKLDQ